MSIRIEKKKNNNINIKRKEKVNGTRLRKKTHASFPVSNALINEMKR
jgi:hypothetical protein